MKDKSLPKHVAIIMDGNRRWAKKRGLPAISGHTYVIDKIVESLIDYAGDTGIEYITFWAWSTENWNRGDKEVKAIMKLFRIALKKYIEPIVKKGARVRYLGDLEQFPDDIGDGLREMEEKSKDNTKVNVQFALNYGGRAEIVNAVEKLVEDGAKIDEGEISKRLYTGGMPDPDLIIRPGGEKRLSGFMLWQSEYSELYFTDVLMPDFDTKQLEKAIEYYQGRERRYGGKKYEEYKLRV